MLTPDAQSLRQYLQETMNEVAHGYGSSQDANPLLQATSYALARNGKLLRGCLLLEACLAVGGDAEKALFAAVAIEHLHTGTLVHDDIVDQDEVRRGRPAVWRQYGSDMALLSGDFLYFEAFQILARGFCPENTNLAAHIIEIFATTCMNLCLGQALEERLIGNCAARYEDYLQVISLKTAHLFRLALRAGALLGGGTETQVERLGVFGEEVGIIFQMIDDLLPFTSDSATLGKPVTSDIKNRRPTAPILLAFARASQADQQLLRAIFREQCVEERLHEAYEAVRDILERTHTLEKIAEEVRRRYQQALDLLDCLPSHTNYERLIRMTSQLIGATHK